MFLCCSDSFCRRERSEIDWIKAGKASRYAWRYCTTFRDYIRNLDFKILFETRGCSSKLYSDSFFQRADPALFTDLFTLYFQG
jgi:hypothetical protein